MTPQELKSSILQLAIQGKLVEQRPEEGTGEELYQQIQAEKQRLIQAGKIKKEKPLPEIAEDEVPFEIPESWKWVRLDEAVTKPIKRGKSPTYTKESGTLVFAQKCNTKAGYIDLDIALYLDESKLDKYPVDEFMQDGDIVINSTGNGTLGRVGVYRNTDNPRNLPIVPDSHVTVIRVSQSIAVGYVFYVLKYYQPYMEKLGTGSTNQTELSASVVRTMLFPLPPISEQKRIVAKIEELLPYLDRYEKAWNRLEDFNRRFPVDMQKSILQMAIQGKLVEQRSEEGTGEELYRQIQAEKQALIKAGKIKKEKPLPEIAEDEVPFEIPEGWKWCRLNDVALLIGDIDHKMPSTVETGGIPYISPLNFTKEGGIDFNNAKHISMVDYLKLGKKCAPSRNDIIFPRYGTIGVVRVVETDRPFLVSYSCCTIKNFSTDIMFYKYMFFVLQSSLTQSEINRYINKTTQPNVGLQSIKQFLFPLPPLAEQKRIVARLEEILPLCKRLDR